MKKCIFPYPDGYVWFNLIGKRAEFAWMRACAFLRWRIYCTQYLRRCIRTISWFPDFCAKIFWDFQNSAFLQKRKRIDFFLLHFYKSNKKNHALFLRFLMPMTVVEQNWFPFTSKTGLLLREKPHIFVRSVYM